MTELIFSWLKEVVKVSTPCHPQTVAFDCANGYLFGEVLNKHGLAPNLNEFSQTDTYEAKIDNFVLLEARLSSLDIPLSAKEACAIMNSQEGAATRLLYQLYVALNKADVRKSGMYATSFSRSPRSSPRRDVASNIEISDLVRRIKKRNGQDDLQIFRARLISEHKRYHSKPLSADVRRNGNFTKLKTELLAKLHAGIGVMPERPANVADIRKAQRRKDREDSMAILSLEDLAKIDAKIAKQVKDEGGDGAQAAPASRPGSTKPADPAKQVPTSSLSVARSMFDPRTLDWTIPVGVEYVHMHAPNRREYYDYVDRLHRQNNELALADEEQAKRLRRIKLDEQRATETQQEIIEEERTVKRLWKSSQAQRTQTEKQLKARNEKIRLFNDRRQKALNYFERRAVEFELAMDNEKISIQNDKLARKEELEEQERIHNELLQERATKKRERASEVCADAVTRLLDFALKAIDYREQHARSYIPARLYRVWSEQFIAAHVEHQPEVANAQTSTFLLIESEDGEEQREVVVGDEVESELEVEFSQYVKMEGSWMNMPLGEDTESHSPPANNMLNSIVAYIHDVVYPPEPVEPVDKHRPCPLRFCLVGKPFAGVSSCLQRLAETFKIHVLEPGALVSVALAAFHRKELESRLSLSPLSPDRPSGLEEEAGETDATQLTVPGDAKLSTRALLGERIFKLQQKGKQVDDVTYAELIADCIRRLPADSQYGVAVHGFPTTLKQALLLEGMITGFEIEAKDTKAHGLSIEYVKSKKKQKVTPPDQPRSAFDAFLLLDTSDSIAVQRYRNLLEHSEAPPMTDNALIQAYTAFSETWPKVERLYSKFGNFRSIDANGTLEEVYEKVDELLTNTIRAKDSSSNPNPNPNPTSTAEQQPSTADGAAQPADANADAQGRIQFSEAAQPEAVEQLEKVDPVPIPLLVATALLSEWSNGHEFYGTSVKEAIEDLIRSKEALWVSMHQCKCDTIERLNQLSDYSVLFEEWVSQYNRISRKQLADKDVQQAVQASIDDLAEALWAVSDERKDFNVRTLEETFVTDWMDTFMRAVANAHAELAIRELDHFERGYRILAAYFHHQAIAGEATPPVVTQEERPPAEGNTPAMDSTVTPIAPELTSEAEPERAIEEEAAEPAIELAPLSASANESEVREKFIEWVLSGKEDEVELEAANRLIEAVHVRYQNEQPCSSVRASVSGLSEQSDALFALQRMIVSFRLSQIFLHARRLIRRAEKNCTVLKNNLEELVSDKYSKEQFACNELVRLIRSAAKSRSKVEASALENLFDSATAPKLVAELSLPWLKWEYASSAKDAAWKSASETRRPMSPEPELLPNNKLIEVSSLAKRLRNLAPLGTMSFDDFSDHLVQLAASRELPEVLLTMTESAANVLAFYLSRPGSDTVDWRDCVLLLCEPYPVPNLTDLLRILSQLAAEDAQRSGLVRRESFRRCDFWFKESLNRSYSPEVSELVCSSTDGAECSRHKSARIHTARLRNLDDTLFDIFVRHSDSHKSEMMDYLEALLCFCATPDGFEGCTRALVLASVYYGAASVSHLKSIVDKLINQSDAVQTLNVPIEALFHILNRRASIVTKDTLQSYYAELDAYKSIPFNRLITHPHILELLRSVSQVEYKQKDLSTLLQLAGIEGQPNDTSTVAQSSLVIPVKATLLGEA